MSLAVRRDDLSRRGCYQDPRVSHVDSKWLAAEAKEMDSDGTPKRPILVGGSGLCGNNLMVLLANSRGCERITVLDSRPINPVVISEAGLSEDKITFIQHMIGTDDESELAAALKGSDCVFCVVTPHVSRSTGPEFYKTNIDGIEAVVRLSKAQRIPRLIFLSSIAVSNHFVESVNAPEFPLPPWSSYVSPYDITKRKGEEMVLAASSEAFKTCALRPGGILLSPHDFTFSKMLMMRFMLPLVSRTKPIDFIDGRDVARGMLLASQQISTNPSIPGDAFWLTKGFAADPSILALECRKHLGWPMLPVPVWATKLTAFFEMVFYNIRKALFFTVSGIRPDKFLHMAFIQQTFDNSKIERVMGFKPKCTLPATVERICKLYKLEKGK